jgi:hypothetical protein
MPRGRRTDNERPDDDGARRGGLVKLTDLNPSFIGAGGEGVTMHGQPMPIRNGVGLVLDCPCGCDSALYVPFANPLDGGPPLDVKGWQRTGENFETLTLTPSILRVKRKDTAGVEHGCGWHGFITRGEVQTV